LCQKVFFDSHGHTQTTTHNLHNTLLYTTPYKMISNFFVLSPRGDTIIAKQYRTSKASNNSSHELGAHERTHTEAFFRRIKFWSDEDNDADATAANASASSAATTPGSNTNKLDDPYQHQRKSGDAPPVFPMPDGNTYFHVKRNGLIFGASSARNVSPNTVLEVSIVYAQNIYAAHCIVCDANESLTPACIFYVCFG
jgi:hypothetical protein